MEGGTGDDCWLLISRFKTSEHHADQAIVAVGTLLFAAWHGHNSFIRDGDKVFRTYLINARGDEAMGTTWSYLDMTALGRQEKWEDSPEGYPQTEPYKWWNWHDNYDAEATPNAKWVKVSDAGVAAFRKDDAEAQE
jgi:predicted dithiol-disulfide oxidoreductase (DUF899 family)